MPPESEAGTDRGGATGASFSDDPVAPGRCPAIGDVGAVQPQVDRGNVASSTGAYSSRVKRIVAHSATCCLRDDDEPDQFYVAGVPLRRDALGRNGSTWTWQTFLCNDPDCPGTVMVRGDVMKDLIADALDG